LRDGGDGWRQETWATDFAMGYHGEPERWVIDEELLLTDWISNSDVLHPNRANVSKDELRDKLSGLYKANKNSVSVFGFRTQFGGGKSTGFALIYDSEEALKKFEPHYRLVRYDLAKKIEKPSRQQRKDMSFHRSLDPSTNAFCQQASNARTEARRCVALPRSRVPRRRRRLKQRYHENRVALCCGCRYDGVARGYDSSQIGHVYRLGGSSCSTISEFRVVIFALGLAYGQNSNEFLCSHLLCCNDSSQMTLQFMIYFEVLKAKLTINH